MSIDPPVSRCEALRAGNCQFSIEGALFFLDQAPHQGPGAGQGKKMHKIFIDPGHGGNDNGAAWGEKYDYVEEDDLNLIISFLLNYELLLAGLTTRLSREEDIFVSLADRSQQANAWGADIFVSIHADAFHRETAKGITTHIYPQCTPDTQILATWVQSELLKRFIEHSNRGIKKSNFHVLRQTRMPAILIETEFISNPETRRFLKEPANQRELARAIGRGIKRYFTGQNSGGKRGGELWRQ